MGDYPILPQAQQDQVLSIIIASFRIILVR